ncbi:hypothetical protein Lser_V15G29199 [Lactuca serriola]
MKRNLRIPLEEELRTMVTPENVCAFESMLAGIYRVKLLGINMTHPCGLSSTMNQLPSYGSNSFSCCFPHRERITNNSLEFKQQLCCTNQIEETLKDWRLMVLVIHLVEE